MEVKSLIFVFLGGGLGSLMRHGVSLASLQITSTQAQLLALAIVNILGGFFAGFIAQKILSSHGQVFFLTGLAGGFTTFSAFSLEVFKLCQKQQWVLAFSFVALILLGSVFGVWLGYKQA